MRLTVTILIAACLLGIDVMAAPTTITHQGRLTDAGGSVVPDGTYDITFRLFDAESGGALLWEESQVVEVIDGLFSVTWGKISPLDLSVFVFPPDSMFAETQIGGDPPIMPRTRLTSAPVAAEAKSVRGDFRSVPGEALFFDEDGDTILAMGREGNGGVKIAIKTRKLASPADTGLISMTIDSTSLSLLQRLYGYSTSLGIDESGSILMLTDSLGDTAVAITGRGTVATGIALMSSDNMFSTVVSDTGVETNYSFSSANSKTVVKFKAGAELAKKVNRRDTNNDGIPNLSAVFGLDSTALMALDEDSDDDNIPEASHRTQVDGDQSVSYWDTDSDSDGIPESYSMVLTTADSVVRENSFSFDDPGNGLVTMKAKEKGNRVKCGNNLRREAPSTTTEYDVGCDSLTSASTWMAEDNLGTLASVTIQASLEAALNPIEHSSGAHLTPGGVWTNASDEDLKENFQPVDGEDILEKIDALPIAQWNYKVEGEDVAHIGPTAQDFQAVFGLGGSDKTISTIDPAGVALAAIKALNEKNKRVVVLEAEVAELKAMVQALIVDRQ